MEDRLPATNVEKRQRLPVRLEVPFLVEPAVLPVQPLLVPDLELEGIVSALWEAARLELHEHVLAVQDWDLIVGVKRPPSECLLIRNERVVDNIGQLLVDALSHNIDGAGVLRILPPLGPIGATLCRQGCQSGQPTSKGNCQRAEHDPCQSALHRCLPSQDFTPGLRQVPQTRCQCDVPACKKIFSSKGPRRDPRIKDVSVRRGQPFCDHRGRSSRRPFESLLASRAGPALRSHFP